MYNSKKIFHAMTAAAIAMTILAGCGKAADNNISGATTPPASQENGNTPSSSPAESLQPSSSPSSSPSTSPSSDPATNPADVKASDITTKLTDNLDMGALLTLDAQGVKDMYGLDVSAYADSMFMPAMMNVKSTEIAVVKLKSDEQYEEVKAGMEQRAKSIQKTFETYLQDQYEASKNYQIVRNGDFVLFSITQEQEKVKEIFNSFFAKK